MWKLPPGFANPTEGYFLLSVTMYMFVEQSFALIGSLKESFSFSKVFYFVDTTGWDTGSVGQEIFARFSPRPPAPVSSTREHVNKDKLLRENMRMKIKNMKTKIYKSKYKNLKIFFEDTSTKEYGGQPMPSIFLNILSFQKFIIS